MESMLNADETVRDSVPDVEKARLLWIDSAKGIGVLLVVLGHLLLESNLPSVNRFIYSFHMPLFFLISGFLQTKLRAGNLRNKAARLLIPFLTFTILGLPVYLLRLTDRGLSPAEIVMNLFYVKGEVLNSPLWFFVVLFEVYAICKLVNLPERKTSVKISVMLIAFLLGGVMYHFSDVEALNFFGVNRAVICFGFFAVGNLLRPVYEREKENTGRLSVLLFICFALNILFGVVLNTKVSMYVNSLGNYVYFVVGAVFGSASLLLFCRLLLNKKTVLCVISDDSIVFMGTQFFMISLFTRATEKLGVNGTWLYDLLMLAVTAVYVAVVIVVYRWLKSRLPWIGRLFGEA